MSFSENRLSAPHQKRGGFLGIPLEMGARAPIVIAAVSHTYRPPRGRPLLALDNVSLDVRPREFVALLGPSGCGRSPFLYLIGGFLPVERGRILVDGVPVAAPGPDRGIVF